MIRHKLFCQGSIGRGAISTEYVIILAFVSVSGIAATMALGTSLRQQTAKSIEMVSGISQFKNSTAINEGHAVLFDLGVDHGSNVEPAHEAADPSEITSSTPDEDAYRDALGSDEPQRDLGDYAADVLSGIGGLIVSPAYASDLPTYDAKAAAEYITERARPGNNGLCGAAVGDALFHAGNLDGRLLDGKRDLLSPDTGGRHAYRYNEFLPCLGFDVIQSDKLNVGDIVVVDPPVGAIIQTKAGIDRYRKNGWATYDEHAKVWRVNDNHPGHVAIWNGEQWVSDHKQDGTRGGSLNGLYPGPPYREARPAYRIYRSPYVKSGGPSQ